MAQSRMSRDTYRLHNGRTTTTRGPFALVTGQTHRSATAGKPLYISDHAGTAAEIVGAWDTICVVPSSRNHQIHPLH